MTKVVPITHARRIKDLEQILLMCDAVEKVAGYEADPEVKANKLQRVARTRTRTRNHIAKLKGAQ